MPPILPEVNKEKRTLEGINADMLLADFDSPLFVISERIIRKKYNLFQTALNAYYPNSQIAYPVKANHLPGVMNIIRELGAWVDVVSGFEYWLAKKLGFPPDQIIFNGPNKRISDIEMALRGGTIINADNTHEIQQIGNLSKNFSKPIKIGLRVNTKGSQPAWGRFGFNLENNEAYETIRAIAKNWPSIKINGFHIHIGTNINEPQYYLEAATKISDFAIKVKTDFGITLEYLDLGGGFGVPGQAWLDSPTGVVPEIDEYIKGIANVVKNKFGGQELKLFFEPGRYIVDEAGALLTRIYNVKKMGDGQLANVDASAYIQFQSAGFRKNIVAVLSQHDYQTAQNLPTWIGGSSCFSADFFGLGLRAESLPALHIGDILVFHHAGAYTMSRPVPWVHPRPAVVMIKLDGKTEIVRRRETHEDMIFLDNL